MGYHCGWSHLHHVQSTHLLIHTDTHSHRFHPAQPRPASGSESEMTGRGHEVKKGEKPGRIDEVTLGISLIFRELFDHFSFSSFYISVRTEKHKEKKHSDLTPLLFTSCALHQPSP